MCCRGRYGWFDGRGLQSRNAKAPFVLVFPWKYTWIRGPGLARSVLIPDRKNRDRAGVERPIKSAIRPLATLVRRAGRQAQHFAFRRCNSLNSDLMQVAA